MTRHHSRLVVHACAVILVVALLSPYWWFWMAMALCGAVAVFALAASTRRVEHVRTPAQQSLSEALPPGSPAHALVDHVADWAAVAAHTCITDRREGAHSLELLESAAVGNDELVVESTFSILASRARRIDTVRNAVPHSISGELRELAESIDTTLAEAARVDALRSETMGFRDFATWSRKVAVAASKEVAGADGMATKEVFLTNYRRTLDDIAVGRVR